MNPVRSFLMIFLAGLLLTVGLGIYGMVQYEWGADEAGNDAIEEEAHDPFADAPAALDSCLTCHGSDLQGTGNAPALVGVDLEYSVEEMVDIILNGTGTMPAQQQLSDGDAEEVAEYLLAFEMPEDGEGESGANDANDTEETTNNADNTNEDTDV